MKRTHFAFFVLPHASTINCSLSLVATLVRRGYRVTYVTTDRFATRIAEIGAEVILCRQLSNWALRPTSANESHENPFIDLARRALEEITLFYEKNRPDLICYDFVCLAGRILAARWSIPTVQTSPTLALQRAHLDQQIPDSGHREEILEESRQLSRFLEVHGVSADFNFDHEQLNIYFYPEAFQLPGTPSDSRSFYAGRCAGEQSCFRGWYRPDSDGRPILLVSTSTLYVQGAAYFRMCIEALAGLQWHVVLAIGDNNNTSALEPLPPHFEIFQRRPQIQVMPYTDLLICLGGMTTSVEAAYYGIPMLMITHGFPEAEWYADNIARLGLGKHLRKPDINAENIRASVVEMSGDVALRNRVKHMQRVVQRCPGGEETANRIQEFFETRVALVRPV